MHIKYYSHATTHVLVAIRKYIKKKILPIMAILIVAILIIFLGIYLLKFHSNLSLEHSDWGDFGSYFAGTIGVCFSLLGVIFLYMTFFQQRKQQFENAFQQYISNYYILLDLINERWLHKAIDMQKNIVYQHGREIFGNAVGYLVKGSEVDKFKEIFNIHNNVFRHHCNYIIEFFNIIDNNEEIEDDIKKTYIVRFLSIISTYELVFFAYYVKYLYNKKNKNREKIKLYLKDHLNNLKDLLLTNNFPHKEQVEFIINKYNL
ncbi:MAG: hypothetical protein WC223_13645 [Bacteroidales bacterium]|jgi:ABC-type multidrug transport system fused ATPase/permease subunit